jgi:hypothetical protein
MKMDELIDDHMHTSSPSVESVAFPQIACGAPTGGVTRVILIGARPKSQGTGVWLRSWTCEVTRKNMTFDDNDRDAPNREGGTPYSAGRGIA